MKLIKKSFKRLVRSLDRAFGLAAILLLGIFLGFTPDASAQQTATTITTALTNGVLLTLTNGTYTCAGVTNPIISVSQTTQLGFFARVATTNASTSNCTFTIEFTPDGTNWLTSPTVDFVIALNGTTPVNIETNFPLILTANMRQARLKTIASTAIASWWPTNAAFLRR